MVFCAAAEAGIPLMVAGAVSCATSSQLNSDERDRGTMTENHLGLDICDYCNMYLIEYELGACEPCLDRMSLRALPRADEDGGRRNWFVAGPEDLEPQITVIVGRTVMLHPSEAYLFWDRLLVAEESYDVGSGHAYSPYPIGHRKWRSHAPKRWPIPSTGWVVSIHGQIVGITVEWP